MATTCPTLQFREYDASGLEADGAFWHLYDESFRPWLREPREVIVESLRREAGIAVAASDEERTVGLATFHLLDDPPAVFLVYLAIHPALRGQRLGGELLERSFELALDRWRDRGKEPLGVIWEVDDPALATTEVQRERRQRRIGFFQRHGGMLLDTAYWQPPLIAGTAPLPMRLIFRPADSGSEPTTEEIHRLVRAIYVEKYGKLNGLDGDVLGELLERFPPGP